MPYVKSKSIHATVNKSIAYILDPKKTDGMLLTTSINCTTDAHDAYLQMKMIYEHYSLRSYDEPSNKTGKPPVKAIHYIMSFADSENVTPEYAQKVAMAFVKNTFGILDRRRIPCPFSCLFILHPIPNTGIITIVQLEFQIWCIQL